MLNTPLREEPREQRAAVIRLSNKISILEWLKASGHLIEREPQEPEYLNEVEEISELIAGDDLTYDLEDDDTDVDLEE